VRSVNTVLVGGPLLAAATTLAVVVTAADAVVGAPYRPVRRRRRIRVPGSWPRISILHVSDLHLRRDNPRLYRAQRVALSGLTPDLLCVTGDLCESLDDVELAVDLLRLVQPRLGSFVVLGNHEHQAACPAELRDRETRGWQGLLGRVLSAFAPRVRSTGEAEGHAIAEALCAAGAIALHNTGRRVWLDGRSLWIGGCDSAWAGHADMAAAMRGRGAHEGCLALIHEPELAFPAAARGADLILAGHTHGGQVSLPLIGAPYTHRRDERIRIASGFQRVGEALLYVTTGLGQTVPLRFGCPPEVVWLDCVPGAAPRAMPKRLRAA
jgi:predicted MPP superfamily phosphohydrolase